MQKKKKKDCYVVFYRFLGGDKTIKKATVKGEKGKIDKEKAIKVFREEYLKAYPDMKDKLIILGARANKLEVSKNVKWKSN